MIETNIVNTVASTISQIGPLAGVVVGAVLTWWTQRNEWGRQRRWDSKRDALMDVLSDANSLWRSLTRFLSEIKFPDPHQGSQLKDVCDSFIVCETQFLNSLTIAEVFSGKGLIDSLKKFQSTIRRVYDAYNSRNAASLHGFHVEKELTGAMNKVIRLAREELGLSAMN